MKKGDDHTTSNQRDPKRRKKSSYQAAEDEAIIVTNTQGNQHGGENNEYLNDSPSSPPDADKTLGDYWQHHWLKDGITEQEKEEYLQFQINAISIALLKRNPEFRQGVQKFLKIDLDHFLTTGNVILQDSSATASGRMVPYDFGFDVKLAHDKDLRDFMHILKAKVQRWHSDATIRDSYISPTLTIVQSSGTGKTRVMVEAKKQLIQEKVACRTIMLGSSSSKKEHLLTLGGDGNKVFDEIYRIPDEREEARLQKV